MSKKKKGGRHAALTESEIEQLLAVRREGEEEEIRASYRYLRMAPSAQDFSFDTGKELYSFSDSRGFAEFSKKEQKQMWKKPEGMVLIVLSVVFTLWCLFSFIYRLSTEADKLAAFLSLLPSLFVAGVAVAIMLISAFGQWGPFVRFAFRHRLVRGDDAASRQNLLRLEREYRRADENKHIETSLSVCERAVVLLLYGEKYVFARDAVRLRVCLKNGALELTFFIDGLTLEFPVNIPKSEFVPLKKAFRKSLSVERKSAAIEKEYDEEGKRLYGGYTLGSVCTGAFFACLILVAAILLIVAHYKWLPELPLFLGLFFVGGAGLAFCNTFQHIPFVKEVLLPLIFSLILLTLPFWMNIWFEKEIFGNAFTFVYFITHCTPQGAGFTFLSCMGAYAVIFSAVKLVDYVRFGSTK